MHFSSTGILFFVYAGGHTNASPPEDPPASTGRNMVITLLILWAPSACT